MSSNAIEQASLTVGEVADRAGVTASAVRFYEKHGLVTADRTSGNARRFADDAACRIRVARVAQRVGLTVREIREIFEDLPAEAIGEEWLAVAQALVIRAERRIDQLRRTLDDIGSGARLCDLEPNPPRAG